MPAGRRFFYNRSWMRITLIAVPYDSGRRGERMGAGPEALRGPVTDALAASGHEVDYVCVEPAASVWPSEIRMAFELAAGVSAAIQDARDARSFPIILSGNCGPAALGVCSALDGERRVVWLDAHGDFNTPDTTTGGFLDGMALATLCGRCWPELAPKIPGFRPMVEEDVWLCGARDLDALEAKSLDRSRVNRITADDIGEDAVARVTDRLGKRQLYVHLDLDVLDASEGRVNVYAAAGGASAEALTRFGAALGKRGVVSALTLSAYDPAFDADGRVGRIAISFVTALVSSRGG
jgi:arginase